MESKFREQNKKLFYTIVGHDWSDLAVAAGF